MKTLHLTIRTILWIMLGASSLGQHVTMAAESGIEYRFERMVPQREQYWSFKYPSTVAVAPDGSLWVADQFDNGVQLRMRHLNADGTFITQFEIAGLYFALSTDGSLWVTDYDKHRIQHLNADGSLIAQFGREGQDAGQFKSPNGIAVATDGSVWVADSGNNRLQHLSASGAFIAQFGREGQGAGEFYGGVRNISPVPDGSLWVSDWGGGRLQHFNADGRLIAQFKSEGIGAGQFGNAESLTIAVDGTVWITDRTNDRIQHFTSSGIFINEFGSQGKEARQFDDPSGLAFTADGSLWVADTANHRLQHFNPDGGFIGLLGNQSNYDRQLFYPGKIEIADDGSVWVVDSNNHRLQQFNSNGTLIGQLGLACPGVSCSLSGLALAPDGSKWVSMLGNSSLQHINTNGSIDNVNIDINASSYRTSSLSGVTATANGSLWLIESLASNFNSYSAIKHLSAGGSTIASFWFAPSSLIDTRADRPRDITVAKDGSVWLAINGNDRIQHFTADGALINQFGDSGFEVDRVHSPNEIALDPDGSLWVADFSRKTDGFVFSPPIENRIRHFNADGSFIGNIGNRGSGAGQFLYVNSIAMGADRSLWMADSTSLQKFVPHPKGATAYPYKAIVVAGSGEKIGGRPNAFWDGTWQVTQKAYKALHFQSLKPHEETLFLTAGNP